MTSPWAPGVLGGVIAAAWAQPISPHARAPRALGARADEWLKASGTAHFHGSRNHGVCPSEAVIKRPASLWDWHRKRSLRPQRLMGTVANRLACFPGKSWSGSDEEQKFE